ncbi:GNAT family N-acetyltransferase [Amedibacillus sp. YH-ame6]
MKTTTCSKEFVESMVSMPSSSDAQNESLRQEIKEGFPLEKCFVKVQDEKVVCRLIIFEEMHYLAHFTVEDIPQEEVDSFLSDVFIQLPRNVEWRLDLYTDKIHYEKIYKACQCYANLCIERESYTIKPISKDTSGYTFTSAMDMEYKDVLELMIKASSTTLDVLLQKEYKDLGLEEGVESTLKEILEDKDSNKFFQILWVQGAPVGFVAINELVEGVAGITYIGVLPEKQGYHYSSVLLNKAMDIAYHAKIDNLIGDIDVHNFAMRNNLVNVGFQKDCEEKVFMFRNNL